MIGFDQAPRYADLVRTVWGADEIAPPGIVLELDRPEWSRHKREMLCWGYANPTAGGAGNRSVAQLFNPVDSSSIAVLERVQVLLTTARVDCYMGMSDTAQATLASTNLAVRDRREGSRVGRCEIRHKNGTAATTTVARLVPPRLTIGGVVYYEDDIPVILGPGRGVTVFPAENNLAMDAFFVWRERPARPDELAS